MDIGSAVGRKQGITEEQLAELSAYNESPHFDPREKACIRYAEEMTRTPVEVPDAVFDELKRYFNSAQIIELSGMVALENFRARINHALEVPSDGLCQLPPDHPVRRLGTN